MVIHAYHGTIKEFNKFNFSEVGSYSGISGAGYGLYFTTDKAEALVYGPIIYTVGLLLKNSISNHEITLKFAQIKNIVDYISKYYDFNYYGQFGKEEITVKDMEEIIGDMIISNNSDTEIIGDIINAGCPMIGMLNTLVYFGYTHTLDEIEPDDPTMPHYIIYDLNSINIIEIENTKI